MMKILRYIFFVIVMLFSFELLLAQTKRALVIGIGKYPSYTGWTHINGDKDVVYVKDYLRAAHFSSIRTLIDSQATKLAIVAAFNKLKNDSRSGDVVYIHFSGHGQQMMDKNNEESDKLDECWIPYDACKRSCKMDRGEKHLTDDEINVLLTGIKNKIGSKGKILVVVDACHSGGSTSSRSLTSDTMGSEIVRGTWEIFNAMRESQPNVVVKRFPQHAHNSEQWITLSACQSDELNTEMKSPSVGKLTYCLSKIAKDNKRQTNNEFLRSLTHFMNNGSATFPQTPVISGEVNKYNILSVLK